jgi:hypothetical protein
VAEFGDERGGDQQRDEKREDFDKHGCPSVALSAGGVKMAVQGMAGRAPGVTRDALVLPQAG